MELEVGRLYVLEFYILLFCDIGTVSMIQVVMHISSLCYVSF